MFRSRSSMSLVLASAFALLSMTVLVLPPASLPSQASVDSANVYPAAAPVGMAANLGRTGDFAALASVSSPALGLGVAAVTYSTLAFIAKTSGAAAAGLNRVQGAGLS